LKEIEAVDVGATFGVYSTDIYSYPVLADKNTDMELSPAFL
jgi:hypothetical protein